MTYSLAMADIPQWCDLLESPPPDQCLCAHVIAWAIRALCGVAVSPPRFGLIQFGYGRGRYYDLDGCDKTYSQSAARRRWP